MGKLNLLRAGYEGKVGQTYGVAKKGLYDIKATPFSHTPHNAKQTTAKNEFTGLNRIASQVVKKMWKYLSLSDKGMYRNNALCKAWKGALKGDTFHLENLKEVISEEGKLRIDTIKYDPPLLFIQPMRKTKMSNPAIKLFILLLSLTSRLRKQISAVGETVYYYHLFSITLILRISKYGHLRQFQVLRNGSLKVSL